MTLLSKAQIATQELEDKVINYQDWAEKVLGSDYRDMFSDEYIRRSAKVFGIFLKHLEDNNLTISHGDLNPGNLILKKHKLVAVTDFAFAGISSDLVDISRIVGRTPEEFKTKIAKAYKEKFQTEIDFISIENLEKTWAYVEEKYILYIKQNHPTIVLPNLV